MAADELPLLLEPEFRALVDAAVKKQGFTFVAVDLEPFRSGRMNDSLKTKVTPEGVSLPVLG